MNATAIILAAGRGERLKSPVSKALIMLSGHPVISYSLHAFTTHPLIHDVIVVANKENYGEIRDCIAQYRFNNARTGVWGGKRRQDSVRNGLSKISDAAEVVVIHDGARPLVHRSIISAVIKKAAACGAAIAGVPVKATIKVVRSNAVVKETLKRSKLWEIQTPQAFRKDLIVRAYSKFGNCEVTDDAMLVEKLGSRVAVVMSSYDNIKITTPEDLLIAQALLNKRLCPPG